MRDDETLDEAGEDICDQCGRLLDSEDVRIALVADSSAVHADSDRLDGQRLVLACSDEHLVRLQDVYARRPFVEPELWAGKIERALRRNRCWLSGRRLRRATGLSADQIRQALAWRTSGPALPPPRASGGELTAGG
ncbi:hypothetical protein [Streptacidiphilus melanogenes]|uniref:hypothetical protein n=1 Tax=Streptacidiphilus melanogenes TaxID=411235 RepID=UPI0005A734C0|nr:hypothetical protein [Streptacidiphilus melanogenes]